MNKKIALKDVVQWLTFVWLLSVWCADAVQKFIAAEKSDVPFELLLWVGVGVVLCHGYSILARELAFKD